ncbi:MAG: class I SAM-dependent methyltransferase [Marinilabiliaceae bacterium]|nr:class I SAM-dependent methyltransferase [Marinilabiliaceae bacterium]
MKIQLGDIETTALIPLSIRANETKRSNARIKDEVAVEIIDTLEIDTAPYDKFLSHEGVIARTVMLDRQLKAIIAEWPDAVIVNLGTGFDNRFSRVDNGKILWFDVDLPNSIEIRKKVIPKRDRVSMITGNVLDSSWTNSIPKGKKTILIAEGLFMYLSKREIQTVIEICKDAFPHATLIAEQSSSLFVKRQKFHDTVRNTNAVFKSGSKNGQEIADLVDGVRLVDEHSFNEEMKKHSMRGKLLALFFPQISDRWATFEW